MSGPRARPTIRDVARLAGVSPMTVSRVINGGESVQPGTAARVEQAINQLGYQRNDAARNLRQRGQLTHTIGLLVDDIANPFFSVLARAVEDAARLRNYLVLIGSSQNSLQREREVISAFSARQADGLIVVPTAGNHRFLAREIERGTKVVCVDRPAAGLSIDTVLVDNRPAAQQAVRHLLELGHRRVGYLGDAHDIWPIRERYEGYLAALADFGLLPEPEITRHGLRNRAAAAAAAAEVSSLPEPPTALFTSNDLTTMGVIDSGLHARFALVGFDDFALADKLTPPITLVAQNPDMIGVTAADRLFSRINGDTSAPRELILRTRLITRGSGEIGPRLSALRRPASPAVSHPPQPYQPHQRANSDPCIPGVK
jgi:DNA-binding LacI/PurR family transcriptional regulator